MPSLLPPASLSRNGIVCVLILELVLLSLPPPSLQQSHGAPLPTSPKLNDFPELSTEAPLKLRCEPTLLPGQRKTTRAATAQAPVPLTPQPYPATIGDRRETRLREQGLNQSPNEAAAIEEPKIPSPSNLQLFFINISSVLITWQYPSGGGGGNQLPIHFKVQVSHDGDPYEDVSGLLDEKEFVFGGMLFSGYYQFRVIAYFEGVASEPVETDYFVNGVTAPPGPPLHIRALLVSRQEVSLEWEGPSTPTSLLYFIYWGEDPDNLSKKRSVYQSTHASFLGLSLDSTFYFRMQADISGRLSILSKAVHVTTPPSALPAPIITNHTLSEYWAWLAWKVPTSEYPLFYTVDNFTLCYTPSDHSNLTSNFSNLTSDFSNLTSDFSNLTSNSLNISNDSTLSDDSSDSWTPSDCLTVGNGVSVRSANLSDLLPGVEYDVQLMYVSTEGFSSSWSDVLTIETLKSPSITCLTCFPVSSTQLQLEWQVIDDAPGRIVYHVIDGNSTPIAKVTTTDREGNLTLVQLQPWTEYNLALYVDDLSPQGKPSPVSFCPTENCQTSEDVPSRPPALLRATPTSPSTLTVRWAPPPPFSQNGRLTHYNLQLACHSQSAMPTGSGQGAWHLQEEFFLEEANECENSSQLWIPADSALAGGVADHVMEYTFEGLRPSTMYSIRIAAATHQGEGPYSSGLNATTDEEVLELAHGITLHASPLYEATPTDNDNESGDSCVQPFLLTWAPPFHHHGNASTGYHHVTFSSPGGDLTETAITSLASKICASYPSNEKNLNAKGFSYSVDTELSSHSVTSDVEKRGLSGLSADKQSSKYIRRERRSFGTQEDQNFEERRKGSKTWKRRHYGTEKRTRKGRSRSRKDISTNSDGGSIIASGVTTFCVPLNSRDIIADPAHTLMPADLLGLTLAGFSSNTIVAMTMWLELKARLTNGSSLHLTSQDIRITCSLDHPTNSTGGDPSHFPVALISSVTALVFLGAIVALMLLLAALCYKQLKKRQNRYPAAILLEDCSGEVPLCGEAPSTMMGCGDRALLHVGDGQSSSSSDIPRTSSRSSFDDSGEESGSVAMTTDSTSSSSSSSSADELTPLCCHDNRSGGISMPQQTDRIGRSTSADETVQCFDSKASQHLLCSSHHPRWKVNSKGYVELPESQQQVHQPSPRGGGIAFDTGGKEMDVVLPSGKEVNLELPRGSEDVRDELLGRQEPDGHSVSSESVDLASIHSEQLVAV